MLLGAGAGMPTALLRQRKNARAGHTRGFSEASSVTAVTLRFGLQRRAVTQLLGMLGLPPQMYFLKLVKKKKKMSSGPSQCG